MSAPARSLLALLALSACASVVPATAARLAAQNPLTVDPVGIEVALVLPQGLAVQPGTAVLVLSGQRGTQITAGTFALEPRATPQIPAPEGASIAGFGVAQGDLTRMRALQAEIAGWKAEGPASGSLSVGIGGCTVGDGPAPDATGAVHIRLTGDARFQPLLRETPLATLLGAEVLAAIGPCTGAK